MERSTLAWQDPTNVHDLHYLDKADISLEEISDATLQYQHIIYWPLVQPLVDPWRQLWWGARAKGRGGYPLGTSGSRDVEPLPLP